MWTEIRHTANVEIHVKAGNLQSLFAYAGLGLAQLLGTSCNHFTGKEPRASYRFHRFSDTPEESLVRFLQEILLLKEIENFNLVWPEISVPEWNPVRGIYEVFARFHGYHGDTKSENVETVTYHNLKIVGDGNDAYEATVTFDV